MKVIKDVELKKYFIHLREGLYFLKFLCEKNVIVSYKFL